eukprot:scaffold72454_cov31-Tisochrysis_lutea.AAC.1
MSLNASPLDRRTSPLCKARARRSATTASAGVCVDNGCSKMASPSMKLDLAESGASCTAQAAFECRRLRNCNLFAKSASSACAIESPSFRSSDLSICRDEVVTHTGATPSPRTRGSIAGPNVTTSPSSIATCDGLQPTPPSARIVSSTCSLVSLVCVTSVAIAATHAPYASSHNCSSRQNVAE